MTDTRFQTKFGNIAQVCYQDPNTHEWIPVSEITPLPITGTGSSSGSPLNIRIIGSNGEAVDVVQMPDGQFALKVDTEVIFNADNVTIGNIQVGYSDVLNEKTFLSTTETGFLKVVDQDGNPLTDIRQLTTGDSIKIYGSDDGGITARIIKTTSSGSIYTIADSSSIQKVKAEDVNNQDNPLLVQSYNKRIENLLLKIVQELEKINLHFNQITDEDFDESDIETTHIMKI